MPNNSLFETFNFLVETFGTKLRSDIFVASYGEDELRFYTEAIEEEEAELIGVFGVRTTLDSDLELFKEVTKSI